MLSVASQIFRAARARAACLPARLEALAGWLGGTGVLSAPTFPPRFERWKVELDCPEKKRPDRNGRRRAETESDARDQRRAPT